MNIETVTWRLIPCGLPAVIRHCPHCGTSARYECSHAFRINANQNLLDVWLIYLCQDCGHTWNMDILSRVEARSINKNLYQKFCENSEELVKEYVFSTDVYRINRVAADYKGIAPVLSGPDLCLETLQHPIAVTITSEFKIECRLEGMVIRKLGISRGQLKRLCTQGIIETGRKATGRFLYKDNFSFTVYPQI